MTPAPGDSSGPALAAHLALRREPGYVFWSAPDGQRRIFGGMLVAQALAAAQSTIAQGWSPHSVHGSFLGSGDGRRPVGYEVEATRDGTSFSTRRVVARQEEAVLFTMSASFHQDEPGERYEVPSPLRAPHPDELPVGRYTSAFFESRDVPSSTPGLLPHARAAWFRLREPLPDDLAVHQQALVYLSDHGPTRAVRQPHLDHAGVEQRMSVSLDHSVWLHQPLRLDGWVLSELAPIATGRGRGLAVGTVRNAEGALLATIAQEALLRLPG